MRLPYSRSSIERVGHAVGAEYLSRREHVEPKLIEAYELPAAVASVSISVDRVTVPMEEPLPSSPDEEEPLERPSEEAIRKYGYEGFSADPSRSAGGATRGKWATPLRFNATTAWRIARR